MDGTKRGIKRGSNDATLLSETELSSETEPVMVSWYENEINGEEHDPDQQILQFLKRHKEFTDVRVEKNISWPERLEEKRKELPSIKQFDISSYFPETYRTATPQYRQFNFEKRSRGTENPISISCKDNFIFHAEQIINLIEKLIERIQSLYESPDKIIFIKFLREMISLLTDFLLFIRTSRCNKYQNENCNDLTELPATVYSNQDDTGNCGVIGFTGSLFSYLIISCFSYLNLSKISIMSILFTNKNYLLFLFCITYDVSICRDIIRYFFDFLFCYYKKLLDKYGIDINYMQQLFILWFVIKYIAEMSYSIYQSKHKIPIYDLKNLQLDYFSNRGSTPANYFSIFDELKKGQSLIQILLEFQKILRQHTHSIHYANLINRKTLEYLLEFLGESCIKNILIGRMSNINLFSFELHKRHIVGKALTEITGFSLGFTTPEGWHEIKNSDITTKELFHKSISADFDNDAFAEWFITYLKSIRSNNIYAYGGGSGAFLIELQEYLGKGFDISKYLNLISNNTTKFHPRYFQGHAYGLYFYKDQDGNICLIIVNSWGCKPILFFNETQIKFLIKKNKLTEINLIIPEDGKMEPVGEDEIVGKTEPIGKMGTDGGSNKKYSKKHNKKRKKTRRKSKRRKTIKYNRK
jgi:hypothetical protein